MILFSITLLVIHYIVGFVLIIDYYEYGTTDKRRKTRIIKKKQFVWFIIIPYGLCLVSFYYIYRGSKRLYKDYKTLK